MTNVFGGIFYVSEAAKSNARALNDFEDDGEALEFRACRSGWISRGRVPKGPEISLVAGAAGR